MERIQNFKSFSQVKTQLREEAKNKENETRRNESATSFANLLLKYNVASISEVTEDKIEDFMSELVDGFKSETTNEVMGRDLSPEDAAKLVKAYGNEKWGERAGYGDSRQEGYFILRSLGIQMAKAAGVDKAPGDFKFPYSIYFDGGDLVLGDKTVGKTRGKSLAQVAQMYTTLVGKALAALAKKNKSNESVEIEVIEEGSKNREMVASAWVKTGIKDLNGIARLYADAMEDANFHQEMGTSRAIGSASRGKIAGLTGSDIASAAGWDGYAIANGTVDFLKEIGEESAANKLYKAISKYDLNESIAFATTDLVTAIMEGTRGQFGKIYKSGEIASVYTHYDSYPEYMLPVIKKGYKKGTDVDAVLGKGDNSGLEVSPDKMKFYGDPNSLKPMMGTVKNIKKYINDADAQGAEYIYLFDERDQKWYMIEIYGDRELVKAFESVEVNENYEVIFSDGVSQMKKFRSEQQALDFMHKEIKSNKKLRDIAVYKPGMHSTTQTELVVAFWGERSYLDNVSKRDPKLAAKKLEESVGVNEAEVDIIPEIEGEFMQLYAKLNDLAEETTDTKWRKAIEGIVKGLEGVENKIGQTASKLGVVPTHESEEVEEGNAFGTARLKAIEAGEKEFEFNGKTYPVESADKEDKEAAKDMVANEAEGASIPAETMKADTTRGEEAKIIDSEEVDEEPKEVTLDAITEGAKEEQAAMELYVKLVDTKTGKYTEKEMQAMSEKDIFDVVDAEGFKGSEAKKMVAELVKIAKG